MDNDHNASNVSFCWSRVQVNGIEILPFPWLEYLHTLEIIKKILALLDDVDQFGLRDHAELLRLHGWTTGILRRRVLLLLLVRLTIDKIVKMMAIPRTFWSQRLRPQPLEVKLLSVDVAADGSLVFELGLAPRADSVLARHRDPLLHLLATSVAVRIKMLRFRILLPQFLYFLLVFAFPEKPLRYYLFIIIFII